VPIVLLHGLLLYFAIWLVGRGRLPFAAAILIALVIEGGWELFENSDYIIKRYQTQSISVHYDGDSVLNSMSDILTMSLGFFLASRLPVLASVALFITVEVALAWILRDNLTLNIISLVHPIEWITQWQGGGAGGPLAGGARRESEAHICAGSPSNRRPQPSANRVSPTKAMASTRSK